ncbi:MAG: hypothetical protein ACREIP_00530 [Alphaproteobacteria bacterium]
MPDDRQDLDSHADLIPHFATRAEIAELREKVMSLQAIVRAIAVKNGADGPKLEEWALRVAQFKSEPGLALSTAQEVAGSIASQENHAGK